MKLIVGLGNPGLIYAATRHNIGAAAVKSLASSLKISFKRDNSVSSLVGQAPKHNLILALPQSFMNLSGVSVAALIKKFKIPLENLLVVCDDLDLELGRIKIRANGSSAGQRGIKSIIERLGSDKFCRLRIGISRPNNPEDASKYVLSGFLKKEKAAVSQAKVEAANCCVSWFENGITEAMNAYNNTRKEGKK